MTTIQVSDEVARELRQIKKDNEIANVGIVVKKLLAKCKDKVKG